MALSVVFSLARLVASLVFLAHVSQANVHAQFHQDPGETGGGNCWAYSYGCYSSGCGSNYPQGNPGHPWGYVYYRCWVGGQWQITGGATGSCCYNG
jgi:hypothetical protein